MKRQIRPSSGTALLAVLLLALLTGCGGGGGGGGGTPTEPPPTTSMTFTPDGVPGTSTLSLSASSASTANILFLEVRATQVTDLYGAGFDLAFPSSQVQFVSATAGPALTQATVQTSLSGAGNVVVGVSTLGPVPGLTGSGVLAILRFDAVAAGEGRVTFARNQAFRSNGQPIAAIGWVGGSIRVVR